MNLLLLYLLLTKATLTSFSGFASLPIIRHDLVETWHVLSDRELNAAIAAGRTAPGPNGLYVVAVGYFVAGVPGAIAGWLAVITPAFAIIPLLYFVGTRAQQPAVRSMIQSVTIAAAGLVIATAVNLGKSTIQTPLHVGVALA